MQPAARFLASHLGTTDRRRLAMAVMDRLGIDSRAAKANRVYQLIDQGYCTEAFADRLVAALGAESGQQFRKALAQSGSPGGSLDAMRFGTGEGEHDGSFPHLWIVHERVRARVIFVVALTGLDRWKRIPLPANIEQQSRFVRLRTVRSRVREHYRTHGSHDGLFGRVLGYVYRPSADRSYRVTTSGRLDSLNMGPFEASCGSYAIGLKKHRAGRPPARRNRPAMRAHDDIS